MCGWSDEQLGWGSECNGDVPSHQLVEIVGCGDVGAWCGPCSKDASCNCLVDDYDEARCCVMACCAAGGEPRAAGGSAVEGLRHVHVEGHRYRRRWFAVWFCGRGVGHVRTSSARFAFTRPYPVARSGPGVALCPCRHSPSMISMAVYCSICFTW